MKVTVGFKSGRLTVVEMLGGTKVRCICQCSETQTNECIINSYYRMTTTVSPLQSCGCYRSDVMKSIKRKNLVGKMFEMLLVLQEVESEKDEQGRTFARVLVECQCPAKPQFIIRSVRLTHGGKKSCGCTKFYPAGEEHPNYKNGLSKKHKAYKRWLEIRQRCYKKKNTNYENWGGRGITMSDEWRRSAQAFCDWYDANCGGNYKLQVDRIDNNGPYSKENCRLVSSKENNNNRRDNRMVTAFGETGTLSEIVDKFGKVAYSTVQYRLESGWTSEEALTISPGDKTKVRNVTNRQLIQEALKRCINRCHDPEHESYADYGGRGIYVSDEWKPLNEKFEGFYNWAVANGWKPGLHLNRIDNDGPYSPENCNWVTSAENNQNKRNNVKYTYKGETETISVLARKYSDLNVNTIWKRLKSGWTIEDALEKDLVKC